MYYIEDMTLFYFKKFLIKGQLALKSMLHKSRWQVNTIICHLQTVAYF